MQQRRETSSERAHRTVHGVVHLGWVEDEGGACRGQLAILVKPNGLFGTAYLVAIMPFRHLVVYPTLLREIGSKWDAVVGGRRAAEPVN